MNKWGNNLPFVFLIFSFFFLTACSNENHLSQSIRYSEAAIIADDGRTIAKYSEIAKIHAFSVNSNNKLSFSDCIHLAAAIINLDQAIEKGKYEDNDSARKAARSAMAHFKEITRKKILNIYTLQTPFNEWIG